MSVLTAGSAVPMRMNLWKLKVNSNHSMAGASNLICLRRMFESLSLLMPLASSVSLEEQAIELVKVKRIVVCCDGNRIGFGSAQN